MYPMPIHPTPASLAFTVVLYFAKNPDEELTSDDIKTKWPQFDMRTNLAHQLRAYRANGVLECSDGTDRARKGGRMFTWRAGPALKAM